MSKWKMLGHQRAALAKHMADLKSALDSGSASAIEKEMADMMVIAIMMRVPPPLVEERLEKFKNTLHLPPLG